jgi:ATP-dependent protease ClpP protease subunit
MNYSFRQNKKRRRLNNNSDLVISTPHLSEDKNDPEEIVETINNNIYFYGDVTTKSCYTLIKSLKELDVKLQITTIKSDIKETHINLHIHSSGGDLFGAFAVIDQIIHLKTPVHSYIEGIAASAATMISVVCNKRYIYKHSYMLIHELSSCFWGKFSEIEEDFENNKKFMEDIKQIYKDHSNVNRRKLNDILKHDVWWDAKTCLNCGLVDEII